MFDIYYKGQVVATASTFDRAKTEANIYRRKHLITNWRDVSFKKRKQSAGYSYLLADDGCCDALRDQRRELYGCGQ
jgi:hypothetical protein